MPALSRPQPVPSPSPRTPRPVDDDAPGGRCCSRSWSWSCGSSSTRVPGTPMRLLDLPDELLTRLLVEYLRPGCDAPHCARGGPFPCRCLPGATRSLALTCRRLWRLHQRARVAAAAQHHHHHVADDGTHVGGGDDRTAADPAARAPSPGKNTTARTGAPSPRGLLDRTRKRRPRPAVENHPLVVELDLRAAAAAAGPLGCGCPGCCGGGARAPGAQHLRDILAANRASLRRLLVEFVSFRCFCRRGGGHGVAVALHMLADTIRASRVRLHLLDVTFADGAPDTTDLDYLLDAVGSDLRDLAIRADDLRMAHAALPLLARRDALRTLRLECTAAARGEYADLLLVHASKSDEEAEEDEEEAEEADHRGVVGHQGPGGVAAPFDSSALAQQSCRSTDETRLRRRRWIPLPPQLERLELAGFYLSSGGVTALARCSAALCATGGLALRSCALARVTGAVGGETHAVLAVDDDELHWAGVLGKLAHALVSFHGSGVEFGAVEMRALDGCARLRRLGLRVAADGGGGGRGGGVVGERSSSLALLALGETLFPRLDALALFEPARGADAVLTSSAAWATLRGATRRGGLSTSWLGELDLWWDVGASQLEPVLRRAGGLLRVLRLAGCAAVSSAVVRAVRRHCPRLDILELRSMVARSSAAPRSGGDGDDMGNKVARGGVIGGIGGGGGGCSKSLLGRGPRRLAADAAAGALRALGTLAGACPFLDVAAARRVIEEDVRTGVQFLTHELPEEDLPLAFARRSRGGPRGVAVVGRGESAILADQACAR